MNSPSIAGARFVHDHHKAKKYPDARAEVSLLEVLNIFKPRLVDFFHIHGFESTVAEALANKVVGEVSGRVQNALCVTRRQDGPDPAVIRIGELELDRARRLLWRGDQEIHLTPKEFDLLTVMMTNSDAVLTHVKLLRSVWGLEYGGELEYLRTYVRALRKKIEQIPGNPKYILSVPCIGYRFRKPVDSEEAESKTIHNSIDTGGGLRPPGLPFVDDCTQHDFTRRAPYQQRPQANTA